MQFYNIILFMLIFQGLGYCFMRSSTIASYYIKLNAISERKELFFNIVETGLLDRYKLNEIERILKFCQYTKQQIPLPRINITMHEPCEEYIENLTAKPWWDKSDFGWIPLLEEYSSEIVDELLQVESRNIFISDSRYSQTMGEGWTAFRLQRFGNWIESNCELFPETTRILKSLPIPFAMRGVMFAKQKPHSGVQPHSDGRNFILTAHLGLKVPLEKCWIKVGGIQKSWSSNNVIVFDTSFVHETSNDSDEDRYVMIIDFWHPELTLVERDALTYIYDSRNKFDSGQMNKIDSSYLTQPKGLFQSILSIFQ